MFVEAAVLLQVCLCSVSKREPVAPHDYSRAVSGVQDGEEQEGVCHHLRDKIGTTVQGAIPVVPRVVCCRYTRVYQNRCEAFPDSY